MTEPAELHRTWHSRPLRQLAVVDSNLSVDSDRELRADLVIVETVTGEGDSSLRGLVFEVQLGAPREPKERSWLAYIAELWLREHVEPALIVVTDDDLVARNSLDPIAPAGPTLCARPFVVHCRDVLAIFIDAQGRPTHQLSQRLLANDASLRGQFLLAFAYGSRAKPKSLCHFKPLIRGVLAVVDDYTSTRYTDAVAALSPKAAALLESIMRPYKEEPYEYKSKLFRPAYLKGIDEGRAEGKAEGKAEGVLVGQRAALKRGLCRKQPLSAASEERIDNADVGQLERWLDELLDGRVPAELDDK